MEDNMRTLKGNMPAMVMLSACMLSAVCLAEDETKSPAPATAVTNAAQPAAGKSIFQPSAIDPALVRQSMQARSEYEEMNRKVNARMTKLYEENPEIKELQNKMRELQKKIDALLAEDEELNKLKKKLQAVAPDIPTIPRTNAAASGAKISPATKSDDKSKSGKRE
jgi:septal ring factor EnvC (AmiA/AmiB activator)